jgi:hypothetical protein
VKRQKNTKTTGTSSTAGSANQTRSSGVDAVPSAANGDARNGNGASADLQWARIAERAYLLYEQSGYRDGQDVDHWLQAEQEINGLDA